MLLPSDFLSVVRGSKDSPLPFRLGKIDASYVAPGRPRVVFDGEGSPTVRTYPYLATYAPAANDRVLVATVGNSGVILGKIV